jgi:UPF0042 nucleotide-binding protein
LETNKIIIITGLSGSGKSTAIKALEDVGFFCVDNLPVTLLPNFLEIQTGQRGRLSKLALVMDLREKGFVSNYADVLDRLREKGFRFEILFLEASEDKLVMRYSQTRRQHPLVTKGALLEGIRLEKEQLKGVRARAHKIIDTSHYNVHELKALVSQYVLKEIQTGRLAVHIMSFGFKYGIPAEADLIIDVRFLPNPYFVPELRESDGTKPEVESYVKDRDDTRAFLDRYLDLLQFLFPRYEKEGKSYLTVGVGCTGGRHRSVVIAREIFNHFKDTLEGIHLTHRDIALT